MTRLELMELAEECSDVLAAMEDDLLQNIAEYLSEGRADIPTAQWKIRQLAALGKLDRENIRTIAEYSGIAADMEEIAMTRAALSAVKDMDEGFGKLVSDGIIEGTDVPMEETALQAAAMYSKQAKDRMNKVNTVMRYFARTTAAAAVNKAAEIVNKQQHLDTLNKAAGKVIMGAESRQTAVRECIKEMSEKGIPAFVDAAGRQWSPEAYINMDVRTTCSNAAHEAQFSRMNDYDIDLLEVDSHPGARPKCSLDQGRIFSKSGKNRKYPAWKTSSYGEPDGILGINCGHHVYPYIEGVSTQTYFPYDKEENDKLYKQKQEQRRLEREVRSAKREVSMLNSAGDKEGAKAAKDRVKRRTAAYNEYCEKTGLPRKADRLTVQGYRAKADKEKKMITTVDYNHLQFYNRLSDNDRTTTLRNGNYINFTAIDHAHNKVYMSDSLSITKPKKLHEIDMAIESTKKIMNISENEAFPDIFIVTHREMGKDVPGAYNPVKNQLFLIEDLFINPMELQEQFARPENELSTIVHELFHWQDATKYRSQFNDLSTEKDYLAFTEFLDSKAKKELDILVQKKYNILGISKYAEKSYREHDFNEVYTEFRTFELLKE